MAILKVVFILLYILSFEENRGDLFVFFSIFFNVFFIIITMKLI